MVWMMIAMGRRMKVWVHVFHVMRRTRVVLDLSVYKGDVLNVPVVSAASIMTLQVNASDIILVNVPASKVFAQRNK
jgi:hypothetical protein